MLTVVKTTGGTHGAPNRCKCGSVDFVKVGLSWCCGGCNLYVPSRLENPLDEAKKRIALMQASHARAKEILKQIEELVFKK